MHRVGFLSVSDASSSSPHRGAFIDGMRQLGYQDKDYSIEPRYAEGKLDRLPTLAAELVELKVDVIVLGSIPSALAAQKATKSIPIVVAAAGDFVGNGLVASLERPGWNITGLDEVVFQDSPVSASGCLPRWPPCGRQLQFSLALQAQRMRSKWRTQNQSPHHSELSL
jgi:ABC-type uncharacterized transport system substrate-binding protein